MKPIRALAFLDSGSDSSTIDLMVAELLGLVPCGHSHTMTLATAGAKIWCGNYAISIGLEDPAKVIDSELIVGAHEIHCLFARQISIVVGRDLLMRSKLTIDGPKQSFRWNIPLEGQQL